MEQTSETVHEIVCIAPFYPETNSQLKEAIQNGKNSYIVSRIHINLLNNKIVNTYGINGKNTIGFVDITQNSQHVIAYATQFGDDDKVTINIPFTTLHYGLFNLKTTSDDVFVNCLNVALRTVGAMFPQYEYTDEDIPNDTLYKRIVKMKPIE